jgi:hypothetical protein
MEESFSKNVLERMIDMKNKKQPVGGTGCFAVIIHQTQIYKTQDKDHLQKL